MATVYQVTPPTNTFPPITPIRAIKDEEAPAYDAGGPRSERVRLTVIEQDIARSVCRDCSSAAAMYLLLETYVDENGECFPSYDTLAEGLSITRRHAIRMIATLEEFGYVSVQKRHTDHKRNRTNVYTLPHHRKPRKVGGDITHKKQKAYKNGGDIDGDTHGDIDGAVSTLEVVVSSSEVVKETVTTSPTQLQPYGLLSVFCEELGQDVAALSGSAKGKQLAAAKRLIQEGVTEEDIRRITRWLNAQDWITGGIDLFLVEKQLGKWQMNGKPDSVKTRSNGHASPVGRTAASFEQVRQRLRDQQDAEYIDIKGELRP